MFSSEHEPTNIHIGASEDVSNYRNLPIHNAVKSNSIQSIRSILLNDPKLINPKNEYLKTPLDLAAEWKRAIERNRNGEVPIHLAVEMNLVKVVDMLLTL